MAESPISDTRIRKRAGLSLAAIVIAAFVVFGGAVALVVARYVTSPASPAATPVSTASPTMSTSAVFGAAAEDSALATVPMLRLPPQAAQPQAMTTEAAGTAIAVPKAPVQTGQWIPRGFPRTPEGALAQLKTLNETALAAADPQVYTRGFRELAEPGAPDAEGTGLVSLLTSLRSRAQLPGAGPVAGLNASYQVTHGQIKGVTSGGAFTVVCVLGQFSVGVNGQLVSAGVGDCQAMRWSGSQWRIAAGPIAAPAPSAWPGSADAAKAGYRILSES
ncbi:hypothetical protein NQK81_01130 [Amycolatopsis roodepoortensis]|uniref:hypothetical protein n=1 Tax=Amycolatopsis roodepoortensis TaxID=700274 RepID=UPI00214BF776|nr:hypothetical protein [Amycolatopsis roodepoortensis]UUV32077.1 hypothetical protein NQK81_01130 [Amycolatopsis roodepoortensis]